jgi:ATP-dependent Clp endopeptidase proteolytic subunit ClpP
MVSSIRKRVQAKEKSEVDVLIYGDIGYDFWEGVNNSASRFVRDFKRLEATYRRINVHINSVGGSLYDGLAIYNCLRYSQCEVHTYIDGCALSMAAVIALGGSKVHACRSSMLMLHAPLLYTSGNARELREAADQLDKFGMTLVAAVCDRTGKDEAAVAGEIFDYADHYYTADDALACGLVDEVLDVDAVFPEGLDGHQVATMSRQEVEAAYRKAYETSGDGGSLLRRMAAKLGLRDGRESAFFQERRNVAKNHFFQNNFDMDTKKITALLGLPESATEDEILCAVQARQAAPAAAPVPAAAATAPAAPAAPAAAAPAPVPAATATAPAAPAAAPAPAAAATAPAAENSGAAVSAADFAAVRAKAEMVDSLAARLSALEKAATPGGGGAQSTGDFAPAPGSDEAIRASFLGDRKSIFG